MNIVIRLIAMPTLILWVWMLTGCQSAQQVGLQHALDDYNAQRYTQAHEEAAGIVDHADHADKPGQREDAAYLAGLSAYRLGQADVAERYLLVACGSPDPLTEAKAKAMLGQVRLDQHRPREAAALLTDASQSLTGEDAKRAAFNAGIAYQQTGDAASSKKWLAIANGGGAGGGSGGGASGGSGGGNNGSTTNSSSAIASNFTLQVGVFSDKPRAQRAADEAQQLAKRDGLGEVRIIPRRDDRGKPVYMIQFGSFPSRDAAAAARAKLGRLDYIVAPAGGMS